MEYALAGLIVDAHDAAPQKTPGPSAIVYLVLALVAKRVTIRRHPCPARWYRRRMPVIADGRPVHDALICRPRLMRMRADDRADAPAKRIGKGDLSLVASACRSTSTISASISQRLLHAAKRESVMSHEDLAAQVDDGDPLALHFP